MEIHSLEVYATDSNYAIIKPPGRNFPGCVIQGDSLSILCRQAVTIATRLRDGGPQDDDFLGDVEELVQSLVDRLLHYQHVLQAHNIRLPYSNPVTEGDMIRLLPDDPDAIE